MTGQTEQRGWTRRDVMRRSAVVGGTLVWAAPAVQAFARPAAAQTPALLRTQYEQSGGTWTAVAVANFDTPPDGCTPDDYGVATDVLGTEAGVQVIGNATSVTFTLAGAFPEEAFNSGTAVIGCGGQPDECDAEPASGGCDIDTLQFSITAATGACEGPELVRAYIVICD